MITLRQVIAEDDVATVARLARAIWNEHFPAIIGQAQVDYMLRTIQSLQAISEQLRHGGYEYFVICVDGEPAGYAAIVATNDTHVQLSKLYVESKRRGRGVGRNVLSQLEARCRARGAQELWLTVNRHNRSAIAFYERAGFVVTAEMVTDIGESFVMDDYRMAKPVSNG